MKIISITSLVAVTGLLAPFAVWSEPPPAVGAAEVESGFCSGNIVVGPPGDFVPFLDGEYGVMLIELGDAKMVKTHSANGNVNLTCHGKSYVGDVVIGTDAATGLIAEGTVATRAASCSAIVTYGLPNPCRGKGEKSAIILGPDFQGEPCNIDGVLTFDWKSVFNEGGYMLSCHAKE